MIDKNKFEYIIFITIVKVVNIFGITKVKYLAKLLAALLYYIIPIRKKIVIHNLSKAFPNYSLKELKLIAYKNYLSFSTMLLEFMCIPKLSKNKLHLLVKCENLNLVLSKLNQNKGVIILTAHFGNWELGGVSFGSQLGVPLNVLVKPQRNLLVSQWLDDTRESFGNKVIKLGASVRDIYSVLKKNGIVAVVGDQRAPEDSMRVDFFNQSTAVYTGTAAISLKIESPILMMLTIRQPDYTYKIVMKEIKVDDNSAVEDKIKQINQKYMSILEKFIRENPDHWFWMHNIWKY